MMRLVGRILASDGFPANLVLGLRGAEEVGGKLGVPHPAEDMLALLQPFARVDVFCSLTIVEAYVAVIGKDGEVARRDDSSGLCGDFSACSYFLMDWIVHQQHDPVDNIADIESRRIGIIAHECACERLL